MILSFHLLLFELMMEINDEKFVSTQGVSTALRR